MSAGHDRDAGTSRNPAAGAADETVGGPSGRDGSGAETFGRTARGAAHEPPEGGGPSTSEEPAPPAAAGADGAPGTAGATGEPGGTARPGARILPDTAALMAERDEYLGALQRLKADFDNYRKRVARLQDEQAARAAADLVRKLLPVLDNLDLALAHLANEGSTAAGVTNGAHHSEEARALDQARAQILDVLTKEGLERVDAVEVPFDPTVHDAVAHVETSSKPYGTESRRQAVSGDAAGGASSQRGRDGGGGGHDSGFGTAPGSGSRTSDTADVSSSSRGDTPVTEVDEVMRAGYRWRGQVLRPAMVRVRG